MIKKVLLALGFILIILSFVCCTQQEQCDSKCQRVYTFEVTYFDDKIDTVVYEPTTKGKNFFTLKEGDLCTISYSRVVVSYCKKFRVLDIDTLHTCKKTRWD